jgi:hypothetical protein
LIHGVGATVLSFERTKKGRKEEKKKGRGKVGGRKEGKTKEKRR